jgi:CysZ protein
MFKQITRILSLFLYSVTEFKSDAWKYLLYTGLIALTVFVGLLLSVWYFSGLGGEWLASIVPWEWAKQSMFFSIIIGSVIIILFWIMMKYVMLMLMSPLFGKVSEKMEQNLTGKLAASSFSIASSTTRSLRINSRNFIKEIIITLLLFLVGFIPGINLIAIITIFLVQSYFVGFGFMDFYLERHFSFSQTILKVYEHKWAAITLGSIFTFLFVIPVLGIIIAPYFTTVTGTRYFSDLMDKNAGV